MERVERDSSDPKYVPDSKGASGAMGKYLQAVALAAQLGKSVEEVLAFLGALPTSEVGVPVVSKTVVSVPATVPVTEETVEISADAKIVVPKEVPQEDKFIVTEIVDLKDASEADLDKIAKEEEDEEQDWSGKIRVGSKVRIVYQVSASRINWVGKKGKVTRIVGNEAAKVYDVEFTGGKIPKVRLNKKTNKLERGYEKKVIRNTFSEDQVELVD